MRRWVVLLSEGYVAAVYGAVAVVVGIAYFQQDLPGYRQLADYRPAEGTRVYAGNGELVGEFALERRAFVPLEAVPKRVVQAFVAAEDQNFFRHSGVDGLAVLRALFTNSQHLGTDRRPVGASTITQQVTKAFLLGNDISLRRKVREMLLALRLERGLAKDRILELYLNEIFLGMRSYGVAAAASTYYGKALDELSIAEAAYLAGLPKAPNNYHPFRAPRAALARRNYVVRRMLEDGYISEEQALIARGAPLGVKPRAAHDTTGQYFVEDVRRNLVDRYGAIEVLTRGFAVRTSLDMTLQTIADRVLLDGLIAYDRRHGWRGPLGNKPVADAEWTTALAAVAAPPKPPAWQKAIVLATSDDAAELGFRDGGRGAIPLSELTWARRHESADRLGPAIKTPADVLAPGDVVLVEALPTDPDTLDDAEPQQVYALRQIPAVQGGLVAMEAQTGRVLALSGGFDFDSSQFNRATQALRQPGSSFKPFVYLAALDSHYTPATIVLDTPMVFRIPGSGIWRPKNYSGRFLGPAPLRVGLEQSRNLMTLRVAQRIGIKTVGRYAKAFGVVDEVPFELAAALGTEETTLLRLTAGYAMVANGGRRITPTLVDRVQNRDGHTVWRRALDACPACAGPWPERSAVPAPLDLRERAGDARSVYQLTSMLQGVVARGTGRRAAVDGYEIAGKTGTTNEYFDAWFVGFTPHLAVGVWVGFDRPATLGRHETGGRVAAPVFHDFMVEALERYPAAAFPVPKGIDLVPIDAETGRRAALGDAKVIVEAFKSGDAPGYVGAIADMSDEKRRAVMGSGTGGLY